jgi:hypothetical protein
MLNEEAFLEPRSIELRHKLRDFAPDEYAEIRHDINVAKGLAYASLGVIGLVTLGAIVVHYRRSVGAPVIPAKTV